MPRPLALAPLLLVACVGVDERSLAEDDLAEISARLETALVKGRRDVDLDALFPGGGAPVDPWGHAYELSKVSGGWELVCFGADGRYGGDGDDEDLVVYLPWKR